MFKASLKFELISTNSMREKVTGSIAAWTAKSSSADTSIFYVSAGGGDSGQGFSETGGNELSTSPGFLRAMVVRVVEICA